MTTALDRESGLDQFNKVVTDFFTDKPPLAVQAFHQKLSLQALDGVVFKTPVDTGRARGNWQLTINTPAENELALSDKSGQGAIQRGQVVAAQIQPFEITWVANNVPYILVLEEGGYPPPGRAELSVFGEVAHGAAGEVQFTTKAGKTVSFLARARVPKVTADGYSLQAPQGMVAITIQELLAQFEQQGQQEQSA